MSYEQIDSAISSWVERHGLTLFTSTEGVEAPLRSVFLSSERGECCQIWIDQPESGRVSLHAADVESKLNEEFRQEWNVSISEFEMSLENALNIVRRWFQRQ